MLISAVAVNKCLALGACFRFCFACLFTRVDDQALVKRECGTSPRRTCQRLVPDLLVLLLGLHVCLLVLLAGLSKRLTGSRWGLVCCAWVDRVVLLWMRDRFRTRNSPAGLLCAQVSVCCCVSSFARLPWTLLRLRTWRCAGRSLFAVLACCGDVGAGWFCFPV